MEKEYRVEINRYEERLIAIRNEVEELLKIKGVHEIDIDKKTKHIEYLHSLEKPKQEEIDRKERTISDLNAEIEAKQKKQDILIHDNGELSTVLEEKKNELVETERKILEHGSKMEKENEHLVNKHKEADDKLALVNGKTEKLRNFLADLHG